MRLVLQAGIRLKSYQYRIQGTFGICIPVWAPKNLSSTLPKSFFFIKQITSLFILSEIYGQLDILNAFLWVKYSINEEKYGDVIKKNMQQT